MNTEKLSAMQIALAVAKNEKVVTLILENVTLHSSEDLLQNVINLMELGAKKVAIIIKKDLDSDSIQALEERLYDGDDNDLQLFKKKLEGFSLHKYTCHRASVPNIDKDRVVVVRNSIYRKWLNYISDRMTTLSTEMD